MTIIVFLVDTSASMQQKSFVSGRSTLLDMAKNAVEFFVKMRQKSPESRGDRYMLLTFEEYPRNIKAGWKENLQTFMNELKNLEANGMTTMGSALKQVFDTLNVNRMQTGIDMYGQGRYPFYLEPAVIVTITDGGKLTTQASVQFELNLPMHSSVPGSELTREPFRWDQRLYALVLRMAGTPPMNQESGHVERDYSPIDAMCEVTGGRSYAVTSQRVLHQCIDSLVQKLQSGVVIHFEKIGPDPPPLPLVKEGDSQFDEDGSPLSRTDTTDTLPLDEDASLISAKGLTFNKDGLKEGGIISGGSNPSRPHTPNPILASTNVAWHNCRKLIFVPRSAQKGFAVGFWPLPEAFWPDIAAPALPQRSAHPNIKFTCTNQEPMIIDNLPFDKYELEPSPLTLYILARKQPKTCWQVYTQGSSKSGAGISVSLTPENTGFAFGYLKASTNLLTVNLFVLPYNYPVLLPLLDELFKVHRLKPTGEWRTAFQGYLRTMPAYYAGPLRRVLTRMGAGNLATSLIPETMDNCLSYSVLTYLKKLKNQAKIEYDKTLNTTPVAKGRIGPEGIKVIPRSPFKKELLTNHLLKDKFSLLRDQLTDFPGFLLGIKDPIVHGISGKSNNNRFRNPFDIPRKGLLDQIVRMRANYLQPSVNHTKLVDDDSRHSLPIGQMGNYQDYLKKMPVPLREIESTPVRQHMFGNPFKINKNMIMDEVVLDEVSLAAPGSTGQSIPGQGAGIGSSNRGQKRQAEPAGAHLGIKRTKKGPLPRDFIYRKTPPGTPLHESHEQADTNLKDSPVIMEQHQLLDQSSLQLAMQLTPPASPVHYQSLAANGILTENKLVINGNTLPNISISDNISDTTVNYNNENSLSNSNGVEALEGYNSTRHNALAGNIIAAANASGNQENSSLLTNVQQSISLSSGGNGNQANDVLSNNHPRQDSIRFPQENADQTFNPVLDGVLGMNILSNTTSIDSNYSASMRIGASEVVGNNSNLIQQLGNSASVSLPTPSLSIPNQSKLNGSHIISAQNTTRQTSSSHRNSSLTNGVINGNNRSTNSSPVTNLMNGTYSPTKRKSRDSRDNSPVPPTFSRQSTKVEPSLTDLMLPKLSKEELRRINLRNQNMRQIIYKEVKRPGKNHQRLVQMLKEDLHGPSHIRREYVKEVIAEAGRFKRKALAELLDQQMEEIVTVPASQQNSY